MDWSCKLQSSPFLQKKSEHESATTENDEMLPSRHLGRYQITLIAQSCYLAMEQRKVEPVTS